MPAHARSRAAWLAAAWHACVARAPVTAHLPHARTTRRAGPCAGRALVLMVRSCESPRRVFAACAAPPSRAHLPAPACVLTCHRCARVPCLIPLLRSSSVSCVAACCAAVGSSCAAVVKARLRQPAAASQLSCTTRSWHFATTSHARDLVTQTFSFPVSQQHSNPTRAQAARPVLQARQRQQQQQTAMQQLRLALPPGLAASLQPWLHLAQPYVNEASQLLKEALDALAPLLRRLAQAVGPHLQAAAAAADAHLSGYAPWQIAALSACAAFLLASLLQATAAWWVSVRRRGGPLQCACAQLRAAPVLRGLLARQRSRVYEKVSAGIQRDSSAFTQLPRQGRPPAAVLQLLERREARNVRIAPGTSSMSGCVYIVDEAHKALLDEVFCMYSWTNPLHADVFPAVRQMEAEAVAMTAHMLHGGPGTDAPDACGAMTSGGTESILLAVKAARDHAAATRGITEPEVVIGVSAHAAFWKAAEYFGVRLVKAPLGRDFRLHGRSVARRIGRNTVLVVASAPGFPHGVVDDVAGIAAAAAARGVPCHVDACLGGFLLPFVERLGYEVPAFDFRVRGVTSMSVDTHKFGQAHKGTSVVLYRRPELRRHQFTSITDWTGGLYVSPSMAGSRSGALIATAWASLVALGQDGLTDAARTIMDAACAFKHGLASQLPELSLLGQPHMGVVAFAAVRPRGLNVYCLNDLMGARGWHLNALASPPALHFCFTAQHSADGTVPALLADLRECVDALAKDPAGLGDAGSAPLYGLAGVSPDRGLVGEFLVAYQEAMLAP